MAALKKRKNDVLLAVALVAIAALIWLFTYLNRSEGASVSVTVNGEVFGEYPLDTDAEIRIGEGESYNILVIKDGEAQITEASCPDKLCINQGKISYEGQSIICLPNKVVVEVQGGESSDYDAVAK